MARDNNTAVAYINHMGVVSSQMVAQIAIQMWKWALYREIFLKVQHVEDLENQAADKMSRIIEQTGSSIQQAEPAIATSSGRPLRNKAVNTTSLVLLLEAGTPSRGYGCHPAPSWHWQSFLVPGSLASKESSNSKSYKYMYMHDCNPSMNNPMLVPNNLSVLHRSPCLLHQSPDLLLLTANMGILSLKAPIYLVAWHILGDYWNTEEFHQKLESSSSQHGETWS